MFHNAYFKKEKRYGIQKDMYRVFRKNDSSILLSVDHDNQAMIRFLDRHRFHPHVLLNHREAYERSTTSAESWLSSVMDDYPEYFLSDRVEIVFKLKI